VSSGRALPQKHLGHFSCSTPDLPVPPIVAATLSRSWLIVPTFRGGSTQLMPPFSVRQNSRKLLSLEHLTSRLQRLTADAKSMAKAQTLPMTKVSPRRPSTSKACDCGGLREVPSRVRHSFFLCVAHQAGQPAPKPGPRNARSPGFGARRGVP
jgi:hypothetical protein